jgi:hypothetical protein
MSDMAWMIEAPGTKYLGTHKTFAHEFYWTNSANSGIRFHSQEQADGVMMALRLLVPELFGFELTLDVARPTQHSWFTNEDVAQALFLNRSAKGMSPK